MLSLPAKRPTGHESCYWRFYWAVAAAQLSRWLPRRPSRILDISATLGRCAAQAAAAGHTVVEVRETPHDGPPSRGRWQVVADAASLGFLAGDCVDAVVAEGRILSHHLVTEDLVTEIARVLRPGGRVLLSVDSLVLGMAVLAEQKRWSDLSDVPRSGVLLVPWPDGSVTRCFGTDQLHELLADGGMEMEWVRPRTALSPSTVEHVLDAHPGALSRLVRAELTAPVGQEPVGIHLVASAVKSA